MPRDVAKLRETVSGEVLDIPLGLIWTKDRQRPVDAVWAAALGKVMTAEGGRNRNRTPIEVCRLPGHPGFLLVTGGHRTEGATLESWDTIRAIEVSANAIDRRRAEISENFWKLGLAPIDRASAIAELVHLAKVAAGIDPAASAQSIAAKARWSENLKDAADDASLTIGLAYGWAEGLADQIGLSRATIYNDLEIHRGLRPEVAEQIRNLPVAKNAGQLRSLAKLPEAEQRTITTMIVEGTAKGVTEALAILSQKPKPDAQKRAMSAFLGSYSRMGARERRLALQELAKLGLPSGVKLTFGNGDGE